MAVGIARARILATVLPDDAANVFITLSARSLNPALHIIARGEVPSTESKLRQAGANQVVLPTHIGAERMAEMILFPETARFIRGSDRRPAIRRRVWLGDTVWRDLFGQHHPRSAHRHPRALQGAAGTPKSGSDGVLRQP